jgi:hypothetical protein
MSWLKKNLRRISGVACGCAAVAVGEYVSPEAGLWVGLGCTTLLGPDAVNLGKRLASAALAVVKPKN